VYLATGKGKKKQEAKRAYTSCEGWRLPTEAEWEWAARGGRLGKGEGQDTRASLDREWFAENGEKKTHPVGEKSANALGLVDLLGNVREWTGEGWFLSIEPKDGQREEAPRGGARAVRGGSWRDRASLVGVSLRRKAYAGYRGAGDTGFRPVRSLSKGE
jgi:formylglycine-generating enzyme required for sulfatase activity